jgi:hypothetical protein
MSIEMYGNGGEENWLPTTANVGVTPVVSEAVDMRRFVDAGFQLVTATVSGAWKVEVSNDFVPSGSNISQYGESQNAGTWSDVTALVSPAIATVVSGTAATENQYRLMQLRCRAMRFTFTPSSGTGTVKVIGNAAGRG